MREEEEMTVAKGGQVESNLWLLQRGHSLCTRADQSTPVTSCESVWQGGDEVASSVFTQQKRKPHPSCGASITICITAE